ncbi:MAG: S1 RNA-binding domain-containing protein [Phycisphaerales bacterium]|nr:30S ribosomal protein S1 [Phycisphaerae bacterium]MCH2152546.1 S1 RNA-binding domain-containing protein [Phycisphaerales bacterium]
MNQHQPFPDDQHDLDAEIESALGDRSIEDLLEDDPLETSQRPERTGTIVAIRGREVYVEFGPKMQGVCPLAQFKEPPTPGTEAEFLIERRDRSDDMLVLSRPGGVQRASWDHLEQGQVIEAMCTGTNKGGLEMDVAGHQAFMPSGQVDVFHVPDLTVMVGQKLTCRVIELDKRANRLVLSRRDVLEEERQRKREALMETLQVGQTHSAVITRVQPYGAFADIGGAEGLIHISDMSWERLQNPETLVKAGDQVMVQILKIDLEQQPPRIGLGMKQLTTDPFTATVGSVSEGEIVSGTVTRLAEFGAFVEIASGLEGLVHISELAHERVNRPSQIVKEGQVISVKVLKVDAEKKRIALSLKQAQGEDGGEEIDRGQDPMIRKLKAKWGDGPLKGGIG